MQARIYRAGALVSPVSGTVSLFDTTDTAVVDEAVVSISGSVARYTLSSGLLAAQQLGEGWRIEWTLTMPDGVAHVFRNEAAIVRRRLYPVITEADLYRRHSALDPASAACIHSGADFADKIDEAWTEIQGRLISAGNRPNLITSPSSFRESHLCMTLALIFDDFASRLNAAYLDNAKAYREQFEAAWARLTFEYDSTDAGRSDGRNRKGPRPGAWWTNGRG